MYLAYTLAAMLVVIMAIPVLIVRTIREKHFSTRLWQSLGNVPADIQQRLRGKHPVWLHAASIGEMVATSAIIKEIKTLMPDVPIIVSSVTQNGYEMAQHIITEAEAVIYFPLDLPWIVARVMKVVQPRAFLMVETELWPNFLRSAHQHHIPTMMVSGRISDRSFRQYRYLFGMLQDMLNNVDQYCMQSQQDADYIIGMGADPGRVVVTGNTKFDQTYTELPSEEVTALKQTLGVHSLEPVIVAGSTHEGEDQYVLDAFLQVKRCYPAALLIVAPRKVNRAEEISTLAAERGLQTAFRSQRKPDDQLSDVLILDTIGELGKLYSVADLVIIGGSFIPQGGHNLLEPAAHGKPILVGPYMFNFKETFSLLNAKGACLQVPAGEMLPQAVLERLAQPEKMQQMGNNARQIIEQNRGAAHRSAIRLQQLLQKSGVTICHSVK